MLQAPESWVPFLNALHLRVSPLRRRENDEPGSGETANRPRTSVKIASCGSVRAPYDFRMLAPESDAISSPFALDGRTRYDRAGGGNHSSRRRRGLKSRQALNECRPSAVQGSAPSAPVVFGPVRTSGTSRPGRAHDGLVNRRLSSAPTRLIFARRTGRQPGRSQRSDQDDRARRPSYRRCHDFGSDRDRGTVNVIRAAITRASTRAQYAFERGDLQISFRGIAGTNFAEAAGTSHRRRIFRGEAGRHPAAETDGASSAGK